MGWQGVDQLVSTSSTEYCNYLRPGSRDTPMELSPEARSVVVGDANKKDGIGSRKRNHQSLVRTQNSSIRNEGVVGPRRCGRRSTVESTIEIRGSKEALGSRARRGAAESG